MPPLLAMAKPPVLALMALLALAGAASSPHFASPFFPLPALAGTSLFRTLGAHAPALLAPPLWSVAYALGAALVAALAWAGTAFANDVADLAIDRLANPQRPLPRGALPPPRALGWALALQGAAVALALCGGPVPALWVAAGCALGLAYSLPPVRLRRDGLAAAATIGCGCAMAVLGGALAQGWLAPRAWLLAAELGLLAAAGCLVKDFKDVAGDAAAGVRTLPVRLGPRRAAATTAALVAAAYLVTAPVAGGALAPRMAAGRWAAAGLLAAHGALGAANVAVALAAPRAPQRMYRLAVLTYMGVTVTHVLAMRL